jgi:uncharacterized membrane protein YcaP (DUF421 family)
MASARWLRFERWTQGTPKLIVQEGLLQVDELGTIGLSREQVFSELRGSGVRHLGQIKRLYHEASGEFSIFRREPSTPGLSVLPNWDGEIQEHVQAQAKLEACSHCGLVRSRGGSEGACRRCQCEDFEAAVVETRAQETDLRGQPSDHNAA